MQAEEREIYPLALSDIDESLIDNNIEILVQFAKDLGLTGDRQQCVAEDQASCVVEPKDAGLTTLHPYS